MVRQICPAPSRNVWKPKATPRHCSARRSRGPVTPAASAARSALLQDGRLPSQSASGACGPARIGEKLHFSYLLADDRPGREDGAEGLRKTRRPSFGALSPAAAGALEKRARGRAFPATGLLREATSNEAGGRIGFREAPVWGIPSGFDPCRPNSSRAAACMRNSDLNRDRGGLSADGERPGGLAR